MMLFNFKDNELPEIFYIFVNPYTFVAQHNLHFTKSFCSAGYSSAISFPEFLRKYQLGTVDYLPYEIKNCDTKIISPYYLTAINDIRIETDAEYVRSEKYSLFPSRLSAIYAFGTYEDCRKAAESYDWDIATVKKFRLYSKDELVRIAKVNMEIVSLSRDMYKNVHLSEDTVLDIWDYYWGGGGNLKISGPNMEVLGLRKYYNSDVLYEYLIEGRLDLIEE